MRYLLAFFLLVTTHLIGQNSFGIKTASYGTNDYKRFCGRIETIFSYRAKEVSFGVRMDNKNNLFFQFNDKEWFKSLFKNPYDGMAIDIVTKNQFECDRQGITSQIKGELLKPVYGNTLKKNIETTNQGFYRVYLGKLPAKYFNKKLEYNILFLQNRLLCRYQTTYNLESYNYDLLDMGMYLDSISYNENSSSDKTVGAYETKYKRLDFNIPFPKNKASFSPKDIKPLYDSLRLTDYNIKKIEIKAYSSIEGSTERNRVLQQKRSNSIIDALQSYQKPTIENEVSTAENWVEFLSDIEGTEYGFLKSLSKKEIKKRITGDLALKLEKYLKKHRKALITLYLDKIDFYENFSSEELVNQFNTAIEKEELERATMLQNSLFQKLKKKEGNPDLLYKMVIPQQKKFVDFFNSNSAFRFEIDRTNLLSAYYEFQEINKWAPDNKKVAYNLISLKLRINHAFQSIPENEDLLKKIAALKELGISKSLVNRMMVNYHITKSLLLMKEKKYDEKDQSVAFILNTYKNFPLSYSDYLSLAQYVTYYYDNETAIDLIENQVTKIDVDKRLLFYYLNLTIIKDKIVEKTDYRKIMLNAINIDKERFCKLFDSAREGGVTFQLLDNRYLKQTYCENCKD
ncbi:hypothetical protein L0P88_23855 [Muricauda sp. SCSIO 64092]|uniref:hypothetical protein n=1 Tax=Allomuricauda sp. SCSIO 64092 TaxID=2908842 RepID=UPI001FF1BD38|nr:hypothetical protein [Muricauda sp. SCSIO 64092]UOY06939.1 hypothetical protein L0P88_23855 [Muricauda sp. SCSIO 64092]